MGFKEWWNKKQQDWAKDEESKKEFENKVNSLLDKFEIPDFEGLCDDVIGLRPKIEYEKDDVTEKQIPKRPLRKYYLDFVWDHIKSGTIGYNNLERYAIKKQIIYTNSDSSASKDRQEFLSMVDSIQKSFRPQKITGEEHFQAQLTIFLETKYPEKKIVREQMTESGKPDIVIDDKYAFELKVPKSRYDLRNLTAQIDEYLEVYPNVCAVIADVSSEQDEQVESGLTQRIREYVEKYKTKYGVPSIVFDIAKRK